MLNPDELNLSVNLLELKKESMRLTKEKFMNSQIRNNTSNNTIGIDKFQPKMFAGLDSGHISMHNRHISSNQTS